LIFVFSNPHKHCPYFSNVFIVGKSILMFYILS
jgi:hypothetical protein